MHCKYLVIIALGLFIHLIGIGFGQIHSPCPNVFRYVRNETTGDIEGRIEIHNVPKGVSLHVMMRLSVAIGLPTNYVGKLELAERRELAVKAVQQGRPLNYRLHFPLQHPLPLLTRILFNNQEYCSGRRAIGPIVTSITLEHILYPPGIVPDQPQNPPPQIEVQILNTMPVTSSTFAPSFSESAVNMTEASLKPIASDILPRDSVDDNICGRSSKSDINLLISKGEKTEPGDWPWLVAIFVSRIKLEFQCAGNLISNKHVLTAAHCLKSGNGQELPASTLLAVVGRYRLRNWAEKTSVTYEVSEFALHSEYGRRGALFDSDLAVITLMETVTFGNLILPICLWAGPTQIESVVGKTGFVVGWGRDELGNPVTAEPRMARVPIVSQEDCLRSNSDFAQITSNRTFCGGSQDGSGPCNGDSGGGLVLYDSHKQRYHLRGVVSLSLLDRDTGACDLSQYVVYTDVAKYLNWIQQQLAT
ncbi:serine protease gd isoform X1 [Neodiprion pinetum]|uniref:serine protease gd-like isoform X1 n=1 Tax=Neodiprion fabricii TaxID=2872261 RepID=UPI001ED94251|nr:serine protease gd-like isoform X1 [Neodiprion fabricii]XP_046416378.1 serine protease gd-like isoform X1 [Neodiprion fabricii]XP_046416379.1 serine protease gd-like isoform X1 [Neodiprion fabricii]XP_046416380.1 serine protease gd-like isoform X1 [Neodiprion fabricii]XP_046416381.1 serine protease gd-like isoform X1 [Neodiprion fabricii]XP_046416383.1 serine protease gd-like isoform X1 [Neodiprion fabricii]XP_046472948.1 serine protease gd-like isoform X1 [Neodiprion pinetum]XP_046472949